jgi:UDP-N-acetylmuramate dehydrogenase
MIPSTMTMTNEPFGAAGPPRMMVVASDAASGAGEAGPVGSGSTVVEPVPGLDALREALGDRLRLGEPLARYTSLRVGGSADAYVLAESADDVRAVARHATVHGVPLLVLGGGTNLLISDRGVRGIVLRLGRAFDYARWTIAGDEAVVAVGAGARVGRIVRRSVAAGFAGIEPAEGIPGAIGGVLFMNAGAYGWEMASVVQAVSGVTSAGELMQLDRSALSFRYRRAMLPPGFVVLEVTLRLRRESVRGVRERMLALRERRVQAQPQGSPSAGSMFKNPPGDFAGRLVDAAGLKGTRIGQAQISQQHGNFFVNLGGACAAEVKALMDLAQRVVWERFQIRLEPEVRLVGQW